MDTIFILCLILHDVSRGVVESARASPRRLLCTRGWSLTVHVEKLHFLGKITGLSGCIVFQASGHDLASGGVPDALHHVLGNVPQIWGIYTTRVPAIVGGRSGRLDPGPHID
jgi:hypothetical protein